MSKHDLPPLDRWRFDEVFSAGERHGLGRPIWGLPNIAKVLGVSVNTARRWAKDPAVPITRPEGSNTYFAYKGELLAWLRGQPKARIGTTL